MRERLEQLVSLAAVRGLRAVPVHARRDQERDPDAVRDRVPAGLRGRVRGRIRPRATRVRRRARVPMPTLRATLLYLAPSGERHEAREHRLELGPAAAGERASDRVRRRAVHAALGVARRGWAARPLLRAQFQDRRGGPGSGHGADPLVDLDPHRGRDRRRALRVAARGRTRERQHLAGARHRRRRRGPRSRDRAARPSAASPLRATAICSTTPRSRRRWFCTCTR